MIFAPIYKGMMVTLFRMDALGRKQLFTVHDLQRSFLGAVTLTMISGGRGRSGTEKVRIFDSDLEAAQWLSRYLSGKKRAGYKYLYHYLNNQAAWDTVQRCLQRMAG